MNSHSLPAKLATQTSSITAVDYRRIEELTLQHWCPLHTEIEQNSGWVMRFSNGYTKRANSIQPIVSSTAWNNAAPTAAQVIEQIEQCEQIYRSRALPTVFRISPFIKIYSLDRLLAERGYALDNCNSIHWLDLDAVTWKSDAGIIQTFPHHPDGELNDAFSAISHTASGPLTGYGEYQKKQSSASNGRETAHYVSFVIEAKATQKWLAAYQKLNRIPAQYHETMQLMLQQTPANKAFISWKRDDQIVACGLGIISDRTIGLYDIVTDEAFRGRGIAEQMIKELLHWAIRNKVKSSYLMVLDHNQPALRLYSKLGFRKLYSAWFRVL